MSNQVGTLPADAFVSRDLGSRTFRGIDFDHPAVVAVVSAEMEAGVPVYYDRAWGLTRRFCRWLLAHPEEVEGRNVLVAGAGVGMESVVVGSLAAGLRVNDMAAGAIALLRAQLAANDVVLVDAHVGSFADVPLPDGLDLVVACYSVFDEQSAAAMARLIERTGDRGIPLVLADRDIGGHLSRLIEETDRPSRMVHRDGPMTVWRVE